MHAYMAQSGSGIAALVQDPKSGMYDDELLVIGSEFGRTPMIRNSGLEKIGRGRDHNIHGFTTLLAGGGIKRGITHGVIDDFGYQVVDRPVHVHDLHEFRVKCFFVWLLLLSNPIEGHFWTAVGD